MRKAKAGRQWQSVRRSLPAWITHNHFDPDSMTLPPDEVRQLILYATTRDGVEPFVRRMVVVMDGLKAGRADTVARVARQSRERAFEVLMASLLRAVEEGRVGAARETAFFAASYAYQNSLDYLSDLMNYLDRFRPEGERRR